MADDDHKLQVEVLTPEGPVFDGEVVQLSTRTVIGEIGVLANHAPVVGRLVPAPLRLHLSENETLRWAGAEGWLEVFANKAVVLIGEADDGSATYEQAERDTARAEASLEAAQRD